MHRVENAEESVKKTTPAARRLAINRGKRLRDIVRDRAEEEQKRGEQRDTGMREKKKASPIYKALAESEV